MEERIDFKSVVSKCKDIEFLKKLGQFTQMDLDNFEKNLENADQKLLKMEAEMHDQTISEYIQFKKERLKEMQEIVNKRIKKLEEPKT